MSQSSPTSFSSRSAVSLWRAHRPILVLCAATALTMLGQGMMAPVLPLFAKGFGASAGVVGLAVGVFGLSRLGVNLPAGYTAQRFGSKAILVAGPVAMAVASIASGAAPDLPLLVVFRFFAGVGSALYMTGAIIYVAAISTPANRGRLMSLQQGSLLVGVSLGSLLGGFIAELANSLRVPFYGAGALSLLAGLWALLVIPNAKEGAEASALSHEGARSAEAPAKGVAAGGLQSLAGNVPFLLASLFAVAVFFTRTGATQSLLPLMASERAGIEPGRLGVIFSVQAFITLGLVFVAGYLSDRYGRKAVMVPSGVMVSLVLLLLAWSHTFFAFFAVALLMGLAMGIGGPAPAAYAADSAPEGSQGVAMGLFRTLSDIGFVVGPLLLGFLADHIGFNRALYINATMFFTVSLALAVWGRDTRGPVAHPPQPPLP